MRGGFAELLFVLHFGSVYRSGFVEFLLYRRLVGGLLLLVG